jgi:ketosteroid isomerase-like protein
MPRDNVQIVQQVYEAFRRRDVAAVLALLSEDVQISQSDELPWGGTYEGYPGVLQYFAKLTGTINSTLTFDQFLDARDHVVAIGRTRGTVNATGKTYDVPVSHVFHLVDGKIVQIAFHIDNPTMLAALGD